MKYKKMINEPVKKARKGISRFLFSRIALILLLCLLQFMFFSATLTYLSSYTRVINSLMTLISIVAIIYIINDKYNPDFKLTWILFIATFPVTGILFYVIMSLQHDAKRIAKRLAARERETQRYMRMDRNVLEDLRKSKPANANLAHYLGHKLSYPVHRNTDVKFFPLGEDKFEELIKQLRKAEKFIFMEYFIVEEGEMWGTVLNILREKVQEGVEVRFMYDGMCSMIQLPHKYQNKLKSYGIKCKLYSPIRPVISSYQNNRDHRKICVIDGRVAFTGGINLADEYINKKVRFGHWKDTAIMVEGEAVQSFTMLFLQMWNISEKGQEDYKRYLTPKADEFRREYGYVLPYADSPFDHENIGEQVYFHVLNHAKKYVHIMSPYLILDNEMMNTLQQTAKSGIEVIIIMPHIPDKWYAFVVAQTYYADLIRAGVKIYEYMPGFVHAKEFISDNDTAVVGTINLDYRSFYHHFECGAFIYANPVVWEIEKDFQETLKKCRRITLKQLRERNIFLQIAGRILRLIAPLM